LHPLKTVQRFEGRIAAGLLGEHMNCLQGHGVRAVAFIHWNHEFVDVEARALRGSEALVSVGAKPEMSRRRKNPQSLLRRCHGADIVRQ